FLRGLVMGSGREGFPMPSPTGEIKGDQRPRRRKSGGGITASMYHHMIGREQGLGLRENNGCKSNGNNRPIDLDLSNATTFRVSAANSLTTLKRLSPKSIAQFENKQQYEGGRLAGSVTGRRKNRLHSRDDRERSPLDSERHKVNLEEEALTAEELKSASSIDKEKTPRRKNLRTETTEGIGLQQSVDHQPNGRLSSRSGRSTRNSRIQTAETRGGDLGLLDTGRRTKQLGPSRPHKRKAPEPNAAILQDDLSPVKPHPNPPISEFDPKPIHSLDVLPFEHINPQPIFPHNVSTIPHFDSEIIHPHDLPSIPQLHSGSSSPHSTVSIPCSSPELQLSDPSIHHLCLAATDPNPKTPVSYPPPLEARNPRPISLEGNEVAPELTKTTPCVSRRTRRTCTGLSEEPERLQHMVDLIMWRDAPKSALLFGFGSFCVLSSSFTQDLQFSLVTFASYLALLYLAAVFLYKTILRRGAIEQESSLKNFELINEADALWVLRSALPVINLLLAKFQNLFSGDPATTMKLASVLWLLAKCGHTMTIWNLAKLSFFAIFTIPKLYTCYSAQLHGYGRFMLLRFRDAWNSCSHKKGVVVTVFLLMWNFSTVTARLWGAFILIVALRLHHQTLRTYLGNQQSDSPEENIQVQEVQTVEVSKME
ncbi:hypothetical protein KI387_030905, partial [Taxus chinensis]